jgi:hypothetical protein
MHLIFAGKLIERLDPLAGFQRHFEFELVAMLATFSTHFLSSTGSSDYTFSTLACGLIFGGL